VAAAGVELEAFSGRLSPLPKSRAMSRDLESLGLVEAAGVELFRNIENTQVTDSAQRQNRQNRSNRLTEVHGGYTALFLAPVLGTFPFAETFKLYEQCLAVAVVLCLIAVPAILIGYECWKQKPSCGSDDCPSRRRRRV
jgi:hypothetical protein